MEPTIGEKDYNFKSWYYTDYYRQIENGFESNEEEEPSELNKITPIDWNHYSQSGDDVKFSVKSLSHYGNKFDEFVDYDAEEEAEEEEEEEEEVDEELHTDLKGVSLEEYTVHLSDEEREVIIVKLKNLLLEAKVLMVQNRFLHKEYLKTIRNPEALAQAVDRFDENIIFESSRYRERLENYAQTRDDVGSRRNFLLAELKNLEEKYVESSEHHTIIFERLQRRAREVANKMEPRGKFNKQTWLEMIERALKNQRAMATKVSEARLAYIGELAKLQAVSDVMEQFNTFGPQCSITEYEALLKRKKVYTEKNEEQMQLIRHIRSKTLSCAAIVRHLEEEADLFRDTISQQTNNLNELSQQNTRSYHQTVRFKKKRSLLHKRIMKLQEDVGLLDKPQLLKKMASSMRQIECFEQLIKNLEPQMNHPNKEDK